MPSPFPGMDPYLESPDLWPDVHHRIISEMQQMLNPSLRPRYVARVELRVYISDEDDPGRRVIIADLRVEKRGTRTPRPSSTGAALAISQHQEIALLIDDEIKEARLEIREVGSKMLVTVIEVLSPTNKIAGARGRLSFLEKRRDTLASEVHWVEIDLLRPGLPSVDQNAFRSCDYRILVSRHERRSTSQFWPVSVRQPLPVIGIPLRPDDADVPLSLGDVLAAAYEHGAYDMSIDYRRSPDPPLTKEDAAWAKKLLAKRKGAK